MSRVSWNIFLLNRQVDRQLAEAEEAIRTKGRMYSKLGCLPV